MKMNTAKMVSNKVVSKPNARLERELIKIVRLIDVSMTRRGVPLHTRPMAAATQIDKNFMEIEGDSKDQYWEKPWFAIIFGIVQRWYEGRYGEALTTKDVIPGVILIHSLPFRVDVPRTYSEPEKP